MKRLLVLLFGLSLVGCDRYHSDIERFMQQTQASAQVTATRIPPPPSYQSIAFVADQRDPFVLPAINTGGQASTGDCWQPNLQRPLEPLEQFPLASLAMKGSLTKGAQQQALIARPDGTITQVSEGAHLGENRGRVVDVNAHQIAIEEALPDGLGCWQLRTVTLSMESTLP
ncbi:MULTISPECIES: pilus assembly protein PilP [Salinivibrio]|uniref:Pilus assembly protein PilP n=1 Tax=Salinivibrio costicola TaxID=51367 RepID=A0ABX6K1M1_SALCS|nr:MULTISPECIES: pilus assembly protein PilP [Salinivibrio]ODP98530.1 hypothetical protein BGK46_12215 [Salinivibrio sp. DV]OOF20500.1 hypothetical protein BZJ17_12690 [Salinivibrio sp. IB574]PCE68672.1 hypothetical protein B6G00_10470 [Salinivibrio sp. YCSC6]QCF36894.1 pilus assembly protein PilP [Salinivibrio sp. YCSC6]QIR05102.1 pilus assembly protein PilP [Salinivibrio costicola]